MGKRSIGKKQEIRTMSTKKDMDKVLEIENMSFEFPWTKKDFLSVLNRGGKCLAEVFEEDDKIKGYMVYEPFKTKLELLNFAVDPEYRRQGVGSAMVSKLIDGLVLNSRTEISLKVRESNLPAQLFFRSNVFKAVAVLRGYYDDTNEDAYSMRYRLKNLEEISSKFACTNRITEYLGKYSE